MDDKARLDVTCLPLIVAAETRFVRARAGCFREECVCADVLSKGTAE